VTDAPLARFLLKTPELETDPTIEGEALSERKTKMTEHTTVVDDRRDSGMGKGLVLGMAATLLVAVVAMFFIVGGPGRFMGAAPPSQTNVNVPAVNAPAQPVPAGPQINIPAKIDLNVNQQPPQAPAAQAPAAQAPADAPKP